MLPLGAKFEREIQLKAIPLFLKIREDHPNINYFAYYLEYLVFHLPENLLLPALDWLLRNKLTGQRFLNFIDHECARSGLEFIRHLTMRLEREKKLRALTVKDVR